nr:ribonuclease H-like domain, reverse transcriptase, RNA-dependent DNA polymerase [Tanacetum cinerariifolium]
YVDDIIFGATNKALCQSFEKLIKDKKDGIFISQDKYVAEILKKFGLSEEKSASTLIDAEKPLLKDTDGEDVDVHTYRLISWQCKKQKVIATSSTKAEYVAAASGCAQVLWMQNQLLDYGDSPLLGVNRPRSDEDRLKLMELMVFLMKKGVLELSAARWLKFLLLGKFVVKRSGDVTRLQALVDKKRIVITEEVVHEILQLDDAEGVICLPNDEIFDGLARMGNEFSSAMASALICLSTGQRFNISKYIFESLVRNVDSASKFYMYPRVGKGFLGVETPLFETMLKVRAVDTDEEVQIPAQDDVLDKCYAFVLRVEGLETANVAQQLEIIKLKARVKKLERLSKGRKSVDMETDEGIELEVDQEKDAEEDTEVQEVVKVVIVAKLITEVVTTAATAAVSAPVPAAKPVAKTKVLKIAAAAPAVSTRKRKGVVIRDPEEELHKDTPAETH